MHVFLVKLRNRHILIGFGAGADYIFLRKNTNLGIMEYLVSLLFMTSVEVNF